MIYGYARVSTVGQDLKAQIQALKKAGAMEIYSEKFTGTTKERPQFSVILSKIQQGDTLIVTKLDRLARKAVDAIMIVRDLFDRGVKVTILNMGTVEDTTMGRLMLTILSAFSEFERDTIVERTQEGKASAKLRPGFKEGRPRTYTEKQLNHAIQLLENHSYNEVASMTGISKSTLIREVRRRKFNETQS